VSEANATAACLFFDTVKWCTYKLNLRDDIKILLNNEATGKNISDEYLSFANSGIDENGRLIVYFAGHGYTYPSRRGEVGFLVPYDGNTEKISSLIRWDYLTRNSDLIPAKHILFLMDACYGGLAITRSLTPGATRFLKDMLLRFSRQVITAGKADEAVSDSGGPLPEHSVFTGHLIEALQGKAKDADGVITANSVMSYVYRKVARDPDSYQTPHFGYLDGDGDLIFSAPILDKIDDIEEEDRDVLYSIPIPSPTINKKGDDMSLDKKIKEYLSDSKYRIYLHDLVTKITREVIASTSDDIFPPSSPWTIDGFSDRLVKYEQASNDLISTTALLGYWAGNENQEALTLPARRLSERIQTASGVNFWLALRWYPVLLMSYSMGIAAISSSRYENLAKLFHTPISELHQPSLEFPLIVSLGNGISDLHNAFKELPGHERQYVPRSEYLYKHLQPKLDDLLFLGSEYDWLFDKYELLFALEFGHQLLKIKNHFWAPLGRFSWKRRDGGGPFNRLVKEAQFAKDDWAPLKGGFFDNSYERFLEISQKFEQRQQQLPF
jgi:hypothetical protein